MQRRKTDERAANVGIKMRRAFAHQVGRPEKSFGTGRGGRCLVGEAIVGIATVILACAELIAKPAERKSGGLCYAHHVPAAGNGVTEGVQPALRIEGGTIRCSENDTGGADRRANDASAHNSHSDCACSLIACAGDHWRADF